METKTIKISEIIKENGEFDYPKFQDKLEVKKYLSIYTKNVLIQGVHDFQTEDNESVDVDGIVDRCVTANADGFYTIDPFSKEITVDLTLVKHYSNLELDIDNVNVNGTEIDIYDYIVSNGVVNEIKEQMDCREYDLFIDLLDEAIYNKLQSENSIEASVVKAKNKLFELADKIVEKLPDEKGIKRILTEAKNQINKIKPEQLNHLKEVFDLKQSIDGVK
jgi:hypothetical protein